MAEPTPSQADLARAHRGELDALQRLTATITEAQATITETSRERAAIAHKLRQAGLHLRTIARPMGVAEATAGRIAEAGAPGVTLGG